jgi:hypothetical protein
VTYPSAPTWCLSLSNPIGAYLSGALGACRVGVIGLGRVGVAVVDALLAHCPQLAASCAAHAAQTTMSFPTSSASTSASSSASALSSSSSSSSFASAASLPALMVSSRRLDTPAIAAARARGVHCTDDALALVRQCHVVFLCVAPHQVAAVAERVRTRFRGAPPPTFTESRGASTFDAQLPGEEDEGDEDGDDSDKDGHGKNGHGKSAGAKGDDLHRSGGGATRGTLRGRNQQRGGGGGAQISSGQPTLAASASATSSSLSRSPSAAGVGLHSQPNSAGSEVAASSGGTVPLSGSATLTDGTSMATASSSSSLLRGLTMRGGGNGNGSGSPAAEADAAAAAVRAAIDREERIGVRASVSFMRQHSQIAAAADQISRALALTANANSNFKSIADLNASPTSNANAAGGAAAASHHITPAFTRLASSVESEIGDAIGDDTAGPLLVSALMADAAAEDESSIDPKASSAAAAAKLKAKQAARAAAKRKREATAAAEVLL